MKRHRQPQQVVARTIRFLCDDAESGAVTGAVVEIHSNL